MFNQDEFDGWQDKWDKAVKDGVFEKSEQAPAVSKQTVQHNFFNMTDDDVAQADDDADDQPLNECDSKYWNDLYELTKRYGRDSNAVDEYLGKKLKENVAVDTKKYTSSLSQSANPIRPSSIGNDSDVDSVGSTYGVPDIQKLEDLKLKLHGLIDKLNGFEAKGNIVTKLENQINTLKKQIDEISDNLGTTGLPSQQGD